VDAGRVLLALALPLGLPVLRVWLKAGFWLAHRLPVWLVAALVMLAVTEDLLVSSDRSKGAFLVKGLPEVMSGLVQVCHRSA